MPPKAAREMTGDEVRMLVLASKLLAALQAYSERPPPPSEQAHWDTKADLDIKAVGVVYNRYKIAVKKPRMHPVVQHMGGEWRQAERDNRPPNWGSLSLSAVQQSCRDIAAGHQDWHPDLNALDLSAYLAQVPAKKIWWRMELPAAREGEDVAMSDPSPHPSEPPSPAIPPSYSERETRSSKGKARAVPSAAAAAPPITPVTPAYDLRGIKRPADAITSSTIDDEQETTPRKADGPPDAVIPRVQVDDASPPPPARRARTEPAGMVAIGDNRCTPCKKAKRDECRSQVNANRLTTACTFCSKQKKTCFEPASWALPLRELLEVQASGLADPPLGFRALADRIEVVEENQRVQEYNQKKTLMLLNALCDRQGIDTSIIPGFNDPPPIRRSISPLSPSIQSASSTGLGMSSLALSDARSDTSNHSSVTSDRSVRSGRGASARSKGPSAGPSVGSSAA